MSDIDDAWRAVMNQPAAAIAKSDMTTTAVARLERRP
jgi:hypothetical protein